MSNIKKAAIPLECIELFADKSKNLSPSALIGHTLECQDTTPMRYVDHSYNENKHLNLNLVHYQIEKVSDI